MRWLACALVACCLLLAGCGSSGPVLHAHQSTSHLVGACASSDCGPDSIVLNWSSLNFPNTVSYDTFVNGVQVAPPPIVTGSPYTFYGMDCGTTYSLGVKAVNGANGTSQPYTTSYTTSPCGGGGGGGGGLTCSVTATTSNYSTVIANAIAGQVVCLSSGDYSGFAGTSKSSPGITITSAPSATVTFNSGISLDSGSNTLNNQQNWTLDGTGGGGTMTVGGQLDLETTGDALLDKALNLTFQNIAFTASSNAVLIEGPEDSNLTFNRDTFVDGNATCSGGNPTTLGAAFMLDYATAGSGTTPSGVTLENSVLVAPADMWNPDRAMETVGSPLTIANNVITGFVDHTEAASCNHIDGLQLFAGANATNGNVTFTGNFCYVDYDCFAAFDGTSTNTIADNACFDIEQNCIDLYADTGTIVNHNTQQTGGAGATACSIGPSTQACTSSSIFLNSTKAGDRSPTGETLTNNLSGGSPNITGGSLTTNTNNMWSGAGAPNINGTGTFVGGTNPTTWAGFELTSGSTGHAGGSDGLDVGVRSSAGPPTGGGSTPVNTAAPSLTGTPTQGDTLTTTNGTWTITGNVPTATTYMWFDCPTATFSFGACTAIEAQSGTVSTNTNSYTLQVSDESDYVFSVVTVTNANGQVNAASNPTGPVN